jgi:hypothetical protein
MQGFTPLLQLIKGGVVGAVVYIVTDYLFAFLAGRNILPFNILEALIWGIRMVLVLSAAAAGWIPVGALSALLTF